MHGTNDFLVGADIFKADEALRYMDDPSRDGASIGNVSDYYNGMDVHHSSGIYNKAFYTLTHPPYNWDTRSAFKLFAYANRHFWTPNTSFRHGALALVDAIDYLYPEDLRAQKSDDVKAVFQAVGLDLGPVCDMVTILTSGQESTISGAEGSWTCFKTVVADGTNRLTITLTEAPRKGKGKTVSTGDADLYVRNGLLPDPYSPETGIAIESEAYDCHSINPNSNESCIIESPSVGTWYTGVYGWNSYNNVTVKATLSGDSETPPPVGGVHLGNLQPILESETRPDRSKATVIVTVHNNSDHANANGVVVTGSWSNGVNGSSSCTTVSTGTCSIVKNNIKNVVFPVTFTVTGLNGTLGTSHDVDLSVEITQP